MLVHYTRIIRNSIFKGSKQQKMLNNITARRRDVFKCFVLQVREKRPLTNFRNGKNN